MVPESFRSRIRIMAMPFAKKTGREKWRRVRGVMDGNSHDLCESKWIPLAVGQNWIYQHSQNLICLSNDVLLRGFRTNWPRWQSMARQSKKLRIFDCHCESSVNWLVVWNMTFIFPFSWECHHPNWLIFFRGVGSTTNNHIHRFSIDTPTSCCFLSFPMGWRPAASYAGRWRCWATGWISKWCPGRHLIPSGNLT